jgi:hypothetical protein
MSSDTSPPAADGASPKSGRGRAWHIGALCALAAAVILAVLFGLMNRPSEADGKVVWLASTAFAPVKRIGALTRMKYKLINLTAPIWGRFRRARPQILIDSFMLSFEPGTEPQSELGPPVSTSQAGFQAWVLSATEAGVFRARLKTNNHAVWVNRPRVSTGDGYQAAITSSGSTTSSAEFLSMDLTPKLVPGRIRLMASITSTKTVTPAAGKPGITETNFHAACRTLIENGGAVVLVAASNTNINKPRLWFILSPTATDATGKLLKL